MYRRRLSFLSLLLIFAFSSAPLAQTARRPLKIDDMTRLRNVFDPQLSPDGQTVAYVVSSIDAKEDKSTSHIWMVNIDGSNNRQITFSNESESSPRFSPDGRYLSFTSARPGKTRGNQVWLLDRSGGEAMQLTELKGRLQGHEWSPDSKRLALQIDHRFLPLRDDRDDARTDGQQKKRPLFHCEAQKTGRALERPEI